MINEFKEFIARGNAFDMAVGIIMGAAFTAIVNSLVGDIIMPPIGMVTGGVDFENLFIVLNGESYASLAAAKEAGAATINYGIFINALINFLIIALVIFMLVRGINRMMRKKEEEAAAPPPEPPKQEVLLTEIRDLLKSRG